MSIRVVAFGRSTGRWETFPAAGVKTDSQRLFPLAGPPARFMPPFLLQYFAATDQRDQPWRDGPKHGAVKVEDGHMELSMAN